jgi:hypothetical protein
VVRGRYSNPSDLRHCDLDHTSIMSWHSSRKLRTKYGAKKSRGDPLVGTEGFKVPATLVESLFTTPLNPDYLSTLDGDFSGIGTV